MTDDYGVCHIGKCGAVCDGETNVDDVIQEELRCGAMRFFLPPNTRWVPWRNYVPAGVEVRGANWLTCVIEVDDPQTKHLIVGAHTELINVSILDCVEPGIDGPGSKSKRPIRRFYNLRPEDVNVTHFAYTALMSIVGMPGKDHCSTAHNGVGVGDINWVGVDGQATGLHFIVNGLSPSQHGQAILGEACGLGPVLHAIGRPGNKQTYALVRLEQDGEGPSLMFQHGGLANEVVVFMLGNDTTGQCIHVYQHTGTYDGSPIALDMGRGGGNYTGDPFWYRNGEGPERFRLKNSGEIESEQMTTLMQRVAELEARVGKGWVE